MQLVKREVPVQGAFSLATLRVIKLQRREPFKYFIRGIARANFGLAQRLKTRWRVQHRAQCFTQQADENLIMSVISSTCLKRDVIN